MMRYVRIVVLLVLCSLGLTGRAEVVLDTALKSGVLKLGYREQSPPFSFIGPDQRPQGYSIDLCKSVAAQIARKVDKHSLEIKWVAVDANSRFDALKKGEIDILCGNTTHTLSRRGDFDFSLTTFVDGAGLLYRAGEQPKTARDMRGLRFVVVEGTTTEATLAKMVAASRLGAQLLRVKDHEAALAMLGAKGAEAYAADRTVLIATALKEGGQYELSLAQFSYEPYALAFRRDADLRLLVDQTLAGLFRTGEIEAIMQRWFAKIGYLTPALEAMIQLNSLPE